MDPEKDHITVLWDAPVILTRDQAFADAMKDMPAMKPGDTILLPKDAVLVRLPQVVGQESKNAENGEAIIR